MKNDKNMMALVWTLFGILGRIFAPIPNFNPMASISLFSGTQLSKAKAYGVALTTMIMSDILLAKLKGYPTFGYFSFFTYTGFAAIVFVGSRLKKAPSAGNTLGYLVASSLMFWIWTNFGVFLFDGMYAKSFAGFMECYTMALPFLRNSLLGDLAFGLVLFASFSQVRKTAQKRGLEIQGA